MMEGLGRMVPTEGGLGRPNAPDPRIRAPGPSAAKNTGRLLLGEQAQQEAPGNRGRSTAAGSARAVRC